MEKYFALIFALLVAVALAAPQTRPTQPPGNPGNRSTTARPSTTSSWPSSTNSPSPSIIYGTPAEDGEIPFQALLFSAPDGSLEGFDCGGSLIHPNWIVTAAHCLTETDATLVEMGSVSRDGMTYSEWSSQRFSHEEYNIDGRHQNDIALIKLPIPASGRNIATVEMATANMGPLDGETMRASGFGLTSNNGPDSDVLLKVDLRTITNQECNDFYRAINDGQICTVYSSRVGESTCEGDSGGPLSWVDPSGTTYLVGITSFGSDRGCDADVPSAYARVSAYRDWIQGIMDANP